MKVMGLEASLIDFLGYILPGSIAVGSALSLLIYNKPDLLDIQPWNQAFWVISLAIGYMVGHMTAAFHTQTLGQLCNLICGPQKALLRLEGYKLSWFAKHILAIREIIPRQRLKITQTITNHLHPVAGGTQAEMAPEEVASLAVDVGMSNIRLSDVAYAHERRLRALTILFGNTTYASLFIFPISVNTPGITAIDALIVCSVTAFFSFLTYCRFRFFRLRYIFVSGIAHYDPV